MKKSTVVVTIVLILIAVVLLGIFTFLTGRARSEDADAAMTAVQKVLSRDLSKDYPATVREVVKYYGEIQKCLYNEECTEEEQEQLLMQERRLCDEEFLRFNELEGYLMNRKAYIDKVRGMGLKISIIAVAGSTSVDAFSQDGHEFARIHCGYTWSQKAQSAPERLIYLLRRDEQRQWKIYGWDDARDVNPK